MIHFTCDLCRRDLDPENDLRFVVKLEVYAALESTDGEEIDSDRDHLLEIHEIIERMEDATSEEMGDDVYQQLRFDLCPDCRQRFMKNPLGRKRADQFNFSEN